MEGRDDDEIARDFRAHGRGEEDEAAHNSGGQSFVGKERKIDE